MSDLMIYFGNVFTVPPFSKKIEGTQYSAYFSLFTQPILLHFLDHFETLQAFSPWSVNVYYAIFGL